MNNITHDFSDSYNNFEFGFGRDYLKDLDDTCFKPCDLIFEFNDSNLFTSFRIEDNIRSPRSFLREDKQEIAFMQLQDDDFESINSITIHNNAPVLSLDNTMSTGKPNTDSKRACSDTHLSLSCDQEEDICYDEIDSLSDKDCEAEQSAYLKNECPDGDLNLFVERLLNSTAVDYLKDQGIEVDDKTFEMLTVNKRKRKTKNQLLFLEAEYNKNPDWNKDFMRALAKELNMSLSSIYKWHWDQKHKSSEEISEEDSKKEKKLRLKSMPSKPNKSNKRAKKCE